jgi:O-antigen ligase
MIDRNYLAAVMPPGAGNMPFVLAISVAGLLSCIAALWMPSMAVKLIQIIVICAFMMLIRIHILQFLLILTLVPGLFPADFVGFANIAFSSALILTLFWIAALIGLGHDRWERNKSVELFMAINFLFAFNMFFSSLYNSTELTIAIIEASRFILYAGLIVTSYYLMNNFRIIEKLMWTGLAIAIAVAAFSYKTALDMGLGGSILKYGAALMRQTVSSAVNPNTLATVITFPMPVLLAYLMFSNKKSKKTLLLGVFMFLAIAWISLNSRANYVYLFTAFLALVVFHNNRKKYLLILIAIAAILIFLILIDAVPLLTMLLRLEGGVTYRDSLWKAALRMVAESPLLGKGPTFFNQFKFQYMDPDAGRAIVGIWQGVAPHSVPVLRAVEMGIFAVIIQIIFWILPVFSLAKNAKKINQSEFYYLYLAAGAMWIGLIFRSLMDTGGSVIGMLLLPVIYRIPELTKNQK